MRWSYGVRGRSYQVKAASLVAELFLGGSPTDPVRHKNGDLRDCRAANLEIPWSSYEDSVIMEADSILEAARNLQKTHTSVRRRAKYIGKAWPRERRYTLGVPLEDRLDDAKRLIQILEEAGVSDRDINICMGIGPRPRSGYGTGSLKACLQVLYPRLSPGEIARGLGWSTAGSLRRTLRQLGLMEPSRYCGPSLQGIPEPMDGEEWGQHPFGVWVSSYGRVAGPRGLLVVRRRPQQTPFVAVQNKERKQSVALARLMLDVFRPGLPYSKRLFINGDFQDVRLANIGVPICDATVREVRRLVPSNWEPQDRNEVEQFAIVALMDGKAATPKDAIALAKTQQRRLKGLYKTWSLDESDGDHRAAIDRLSSDGTFIGNGRV